MNKVFSHFVKFRILTALGMRDLIIYSFINFREFPRGIFLILLSSGSLSTERNDGICKLRFSQSCVFNRVVSDLKMYSVRIKTACKKYRGRVAEPHARNIVL